MRIRNATDKVRAKVLANALVNPKFSAANLSRSCTIRTSGSINSTRSGLGLRNVIVNAGFPGGCISLCNNHKWVARFQRSSRKSSNTPMYSHPSRSPACAGWWKLNAQQIMTAFCTIDAARQSAYAAFARYGSRTGLGFSPAPAPALALARLLWSQIPKCSVQQCIVTLIQRSSASMNADWQSYSQYPLACMPKL